MIANYTAIDILGTTEATLLTSLFLFVPGYVLGWVLDVFGFRRRRPVLKFLLSVPLSIACFPILTYLLERYLPHSAVWVFYGVVWGVFLLLIARSSLKFRLRWPSRYVWLCVAATVFWTGVGMVSLIDIQTHHRLYFSVPAYDYSIRAAFTAAMARAFPPANPFFASSPPVVLRYHYFWMLPCALIVQLAGLSPRHAMFGATLWCGIGLMALIAIYLKFFLRQQTQIERKVLIGISLLVVTGLDILPTITLGLLKPHVFFPDLEWWNAPQITSWVDTMIWVPHHLSALIACLTGFLILECSPEKKRGTAVALAGLSFASAAGLSVYVTFTFALFLGVWTIIFAAKKQTREVTLVLRAGIVGGLLAVGFLHGLTAPGEGHAFVQFALRKFTFATELLSRYGHPSHGTSVLASTLLMPLNYFLELGFFLMVGIERLLRLLRHEIEWTRQELAAWTLVGTSFFVGSFIRSATIDNNDLGFRCFLFAQFVLLLWAVAMVENWWRARASNPAFKPSTGRAFKAVAVSCLLLGVLGTTYQVISLRVYPMLLDRPGGAAFYQPWLDTDGQLGKRTFALRSAYEQLEASLPASAVIQFNPVTPGYLPHLLYSGHPAVAVGSDCGTVFGGRPQDCPARIQKLSRAYSPPNAIAGVELSTLCAQMGIDAVIVKDTDPAWRERSSWVWRETPIIANDYVRAFRCDEQDRLPAASVKSANTPLGP